MTGRWWWIAGAVLIAVAAITAGVASESQAAEVFFVLALLWASRPSVGRCGGCGTG